MDWFKQLKGKLRFNEPLSKYTSFKIGGKASVFFEPKDTIDLIKCLKNLKKFRVPYFLIGKGTNLLIKDSDFKGMVIRLTSPFFKNTNIKGNLITVGAGVSLSELVDYLSAKKEFSGFEFLAGIPGSVAGALVMNAGVTIEGERHNIAHIVNKVKVIDKNAKIVSLSKPECGFSYRKSQLNKFVILEAQISLTKNKKASSKNRIKDLLLYRKLSQDYSKPNAGCIFKNPSRSVSAGKLIEQCGLKGFQHGGAIVSQKHANFILNFNRATAKDVIELIHIIKKNVSDKFGISLKEEIKIVS